MDFTFQFGEFFNQPSNTFWAIVIGPIVASAIFIVDKIVVRNRITDDQNNLYDYFLLMMDKSILEIEKQISNYKKFSNTLSESPYDINKSMAFSNFYNLEKIVNGIDLVKLFKSFLIANDMKSSTKDSFNEIMTTSSHTLIVFNDSKLKLSEINDRKSESVHSMNETNTQIEMDVATIISSKNANGEVEDDFFNSIQQILPLFNKKKLDKKDEHYTILFELYNTDLILPMIGLGSFVGDKIDAVRLMEKVYRSNRLFKQLKVQSEFDSKNFKTFDETLTKRKDKLVEELSKCKRQ